MRFHFLLLLPLLLQSTAFATPLDTIIPPATFSMSGPGGGGATYSPSLSPHGDDKVFINCDMAGVYRSNDRGQHWSLYHADQLVSSIKAQVQFTSDPNVLYTIDRSTDYNSLFRHHPMKSTNGGDTWQAITDPSSTGVHRLLADPGSTQRLLTNEYDRLFFSGNGGTSYSQVFLPPGGGTVWLGGAFWDGNDIFVGTDHGLLVSHDGGVSFAIEAHAGLPAGSGIYQLAGAKEGGVLRLFAIPVPATLLLPWEDWRNFLGSYQGLYAMTYSPTAAWTNARGNIPAGHEVILTDLAQNEKDIVYASAHNNGWPLIYKSLNGGSTWSNVFVATPNNQNIYTGYGSEEGTFSYYWAGAGLGFDVSGSDPNLLAMTNYGMPHLSYDGGTTWRQCYTDSAHQHSPGTEPLPGDPYITNGLSLTSGHHLHWVDATKLFSSNADIGNQYSQNSGGTWTFGRNTFETWGALKDGNWYNIAKHPSNSTLFAAVADMNDAHLEYRIADAEIHGTGRVLSSSNEGQNWSIVHEFGHPVVWFAQDQEAPARMFASVVHHPDGGIFRSEDGGTNWLKLNLPARTQGRPYTIRTLGSGDLVATCSARKVRNYSNDFDSLTVSSGVFYSEDNGNTWLDRSDPGMMRYTKDITIDPHDPTKNTWYACVWGGLGPTYDGNGGVYRTTNRGLTWARIFTHLRAESLTIHPNDPKVAYLTTEFGGLWRCGNLSAASPVFYKVQNFPYPRSKRTFYNPHNVNELWVTTMGAGIWRGLESQSSAGNITVVPGNACNGSGVLLIAPLGQSYLWDNGYGGQVLTVHPYEVTTYSVTVTAANGSTAVSSVTLDPLDHTPVSLTAATAAFTDGSGDEDYFDMTACRWLIEPPGATSIALYFEEFMTEEDYDFVRIFDGPTTSHPLLAEYSGNGVPPPVFSTGGSVLVHFDADESITDAGWSAYYEATGCPADLTVMGLPIPSGTYRAGNHLQSNGRVDIGTEVIFTSQVQVTLNAGFEVQAGGVLEVLTGVGCN